MKRLVILSTALVVAAAFSSSAYATQRYVLKQQPTVSYRAGVVGKPMLAPAQPGFYGNNTSGILARDGAGILARDGAGFARGARGW